MYTRSTRVRGGAGYHTELAGRDRFKFFRRPVESSIEEFPGEDAEQNAENSYANTGGAATSRWGNGTVRFSATYSPSQTLPEGGIPRGYRTVASSSRPMSSCARNIVLQRSRGHAAHPVTSQRPTRPVRLPQLEGSATSIPRRAGGMAGKGNEGGDEAVAGAAMREASIQTMYRENDAQTDPYTPDYYIPDGAPADLEILQLQTLTWQNGGLPAGREEVDLIQRLRRRRAIEASIKASADDPTKKEENYAKYRELEELEWAEREQHIAKQQARRFEGIKVSLLEREKAREEVNQERLEKIKEEYLTKLQGKLRSLHARHRASNQRAITQRCKGNQRLVGNGIVTPSGANKEELIQSFIKYGMEAAPPTPPFSTLAPQLHQSIAATGGGADTRSTASRALTYDVRPTLLAAVEGTEEVERVRGARIEHVPPETFCYPVNQAVQGLPTLYRRAEAERLVKSLDYAQKKIDQEKGLLLDDELLAKDAPVLTTARVLDLYLVTPKVQRPDTPVLELEGDAEERVQDACVLLQRLIRGRAVQNDFFEGKERCKGLIKELQAASEAKRLEEFERTSHEAETAETNRREEAAVQAVLGVAVGDIIHDTLCFLYQELQRQQDAEQLTQLHVEAMVERQRREKTELERREKARMERERGEVQYAALVRATRITATAFLEEMEDVAIEETALQVSVDRERERQAALPPLHEPVDVVERENLVCDMWDNFVVPAVLDRLTRQEEELEKKAPAAVVMEIFKSFSHPLSGSFM